MMQYVSLHLIPIAILIPVTQFMANSSKATEVPYGTALHSHASSSPLPLPCPFLVFTNKLYNNKSVLNHRPRLY